MCIIYTAHILRTLQMCIWYLGSEVYVHKSCAQGVIVMLLPSLLLPVWIEKMKTITDQVQLISSNFNQEKLLDIQRKADLLAPLNSSATNLARSVQSYLNETELSFPMIESKVRTLF